MSALRLTRWFSARTLEVMPPRFEGLPAGTLVRDVDTITTTGGYLSTTLLASMDGGVTWTKYLVFGPVDTEEAEG